MSSLRSLSLNGVLKAAGERKRWLYPMLWTVLGILILTIMLPTPFQHAATSSLESSATTASNDTPSSSRTPHELLPYYQLLTGAPSTDGKPSPNSQDPLITANVTTSAKVAVIMETRRSAALIPLILHFAAVLGPDWPIVIYTSAENFGSFSTSRALARHQRAGRIVVRALAEGAYFPTWESVSDFLTNPWLWHALAPAENILLFQSDSILCSSSPRSVEDYFDYDLIGAPIAANLGVGYNGGLSIRKRSAMLRVLDEFSWKENPRPFAEDQWYFARLRDLQDQEEANGIPEEEWSIKLPSMEMARSFAVESIDFPSPLGLHQPTRFLSSHMVPLDDSCPEWRLASSAGFYT